MEIVHEISSENGSIRSWFEKGEAAIGESNHSEAARCFGRVLKADPFNAKAHCRLSNAYWAQGKTEDALNSLTRALELDPGDRDTVLACSDVFVAFGKTDFAQEVLRSYSEKNPQDKEIFCRLKSIEEPVDGDRSNDTAEFFRKQGEIRFERGDLPHAAACFEMAIGENPRLAAAYNNLGVVYLETGKITEALENFHKALELKAEDTEVLANSARALARAAQTDAAIEVFREYLRRSPGDSRAWLEFESLIRESSAPAWSAEGLSDEVADIYLNAAEMLGKAGDLPGAVQAIGRALRIKPATPQSLYVLACLHQALGQREDAESMLAQALAIDPSHGPCSDMLESLKSN